MATTGLIEVSVTRMAITTSTTNTGNFFGDFPDPAFNPYTFPFPGTVTKVIINTLAGGPDLGGGNFNLFLYTGSAGAGADQGALALASAIGLDIHVVNYPFLAGDGFTFTMQANNPGANFSFFIEVEYDLA